MRQMLSELRILPVLLGVFAAMLCILTANVWADTGPCDDVDREDIYFCNVEGLFGTSRWCPEFKYNQKQVCYNTNDVCCTNFTDKDQVNYIEYNWDVLQAGGVSGWTCVANGTYSFVPGDEGNPPTVGAGVTCSWSTHVKCWCAGNHQENHMYLPLCYGG